MEPTTIIGILLLFLAGAIIFFFLQHMVIQDYQIENQLLKDQLERKNNPTEVIFSTNTIHNEFLAIFKDELKG